jgi:hypothetical protein
MKKFPSGVIKRCLAGGAILLGGGCSADVVSSISSDEPALVELDRALLEGAADGCEGLLLGDERFVADEHALLVAIRGDRAVCRDTDEAIALELDAVSARIAADLRADTSGIDPRGEELHLVPVYALGDPNPEPGQPGGEMQGNDDLVAADGGPSLTDEPIDLGDPNPEPGVRTLSNPSLHQKTPLERPELP